MTSQEYPRPSESPSSLIRDSRPLLGRVFHIVIFNHQKTASHTEGGFLAQIRLSTEIRCSHRAFRQKLFVLELMFIIYQGRRVLQALFEHFLHNLSEFPQRHLLSYPHQPRQLALHHSVVSQYSRHC